MFGTFIDSEGIIHKEFVLPGQTVKKEYYAEVLSHLVQTVHQVRPQFQERRWSLLHDVRCHTAVSIQQFLTKQGIPELNHTPILLIYPRQTFFIPQNEMCTEREKI
jgi:hypothetical protein